MSTTLDMEFFIDDAFKSVTATRTSSSGSYVDGIFAPSAGSPENFDVTLQSLNQKDINFLDNGGERTTDTRKVYVNTNISSLDNRDVWSFSGVDGTFKAVGIDNRPWRNYCRFYAVRLDV